MDYIAKAGSKKILDACESSTNYFIRAVMAGMFLAVAMFLSYSLGALFQDNPAVSKTLVAFTFGIGIVVIIFFKTELFTGNCFTTAVTLYRGDCTVRQLVRSWTLCYLGNVVGVIIMVTLFMLTQTSDSPFNTYITNSVEYKLHFDYLQIFVKAILCNFIVCSATYTSYKLKDETAKVIVIIFLIAAFYLPGFEHCIANFGSFTMAMIAEGGSVNLGAMGMHTLVATLGNIIGGTFLFATPMFILIRHDKQKA